jgi:phosphate transport system permease protein
MLIGNTPKISLSLLSPAHTLASVIANEFTEATSDDYLHALFAAGLVLLGVTVIVNLFAQFLLKAFAGSAGGPARG